MKNKCLNCQTILDDNKSKWCSMGCKKQFLLNHYRPDATIRAMLEHKKEFREKQRKILKEIKESGLTFTEFIRSLGDFKEEQGGSE